MHTSRLTAAVLILVLGVLIAGCGSNPEGNAGVGPAPISNAGPDQNVATGTVVSLDATGSSAAGNRALTLAWSFTAKPAGSAAALSDATAARPTFTPDKDGSYVISLIVNDGLVDSAPDTVTITASLPPDTSAPSAPKQLTASVASSGQINLSWQAATDNVAVTGYSIYRDGSYLASSVSTSFQDSGRTASTQYCYTVASVDGAGNISVLSGQSCAMTSAASIVMTGTTTTYSIIQYYFVRNTASLTQETTFLISHDRTEFDARFSPIPSISQPFDMTSKFMLSVIKYGACTWAMDVQGVTIEGSTIRIYYSATKTADNLTWIAAMPLHVMLDHVAFTKVQLFENGNLLAEL